jgi:hypothetical protein
MARGSGAGVTDPRDTWRDRAELVRIAARRAGESHAGISAHYHVGACPAVAVSAWSPGGAARPCMSSCSLLPALPSCCAARRLWEPAVRHPPMCFGLPLHARKHPRASMLRT